MEPAIGRVCYLTLDIYTRYIEHDVTNHTCIIMNQECRGLAVAPVLHNLDMYMKAFNIMNKSVESALGLSRDHEYRPNWYSYITLYRRSVTNLSGPRAQCGF